MYEFLIFNCIDTFHHSVTWLPPCSIFPLQKCLNGVLISSLSAYLSWLLCQAMWCSAPLLSNAGGGALGSISDLLHIVPSSALRTISPQSCSLAYN